MTRRQRLNGLLFDTTTVCGLNRVGYVDVRNIFNSPRNNYPKRTLISAISPKNNLMFIIRGWGL